MILRIVKMAASGSTTSSRHCDICKVNLTLKYGNSSHCVSSVSLFCPTTNKEFCQSFKDKPVIVNDLLRAVGIVLSRQDVQSGSLCKKCARKVLNCFKLYTELKNAFAKDSSSVTTTTDTITNKQSTPKRPEPKHNNETIKTNKRSMYITSPTGLTPHSKRPKPKDKNVIADDESIPIPRESTSISRAKKTLFNDEQKTSNDYGVLEDHILSLMDVPIDVHAGSNEVNEPLSHTPPLVKIFVGYPKSCRVIERSCEDKWESVMVKNICQENYHHAAYAAMNFHPFRRELVKEVSNAVKRELKNYSHGPSVAKYNGDPLSLTDYNSKRLLNDAEVNLPVLYEIVKGSTKPQTKKFVEHKQALMLSSFLNTWIPRSNFIYRINTLLFTGCCKTEIVDLFHRLGLSCHPNTIRSQVQAAANYFDNEIVMWKKEIEVNKKALKLLEEVLECQTVYAGEEYMTICSIDFALDKISKYKFYDSNTYKKCCSLLPNGTYHQDTDILKVIADLQGEKLPRYRIVGDNVDLELSARIQSHKKPNKSLHWFNEYAVKDRVSDESLSDTPQKSIGSLEMREFLPTPEVQTEFANDLKVVISRIIIDYLPAYKMFSDSVVYHIPHKFSAQMNEISEVCSLGLDFHNSNKAAEMASILQQLQEQFVPTADVGEDKEILEQVILDGDQLTEERARNAQIANSLADTPYEKIHGLHTSFADWHLGKNLLMGSKV